MASNVQETKELKDLSEKEVAILLEKMKCKTITNSLLSGEFGEITGEVLEELNDQTLQSIGINIPFQRRQFLRLIERYTEEGVSIDLLRNDEILEKQSPKTDQTIVIDDKAKLRALIQKSERMHNACTSEMDIYAFPAKKIQVKDLQQPLYGANLKKIIIMGETGSGKSTFINAFINYAVGVQMEDSFRFKLVVDKADRESDQSISQTSEISGYFIEDTLLDFPIQIWDTPGFGDTRGVERDEEIKKQINELLKLEDYFHAVCFVVKANANRLTDTQKYIIDRVLLFFGKEAQENIYLLTTFADDSPRPDVLHALEKCNNFPFDENRWFAFENGSLFKSASERTDFSKTNWHGVTVNMNRLLDDIGEICPFGLTSTKEIIAQREDLSQNLNAIVIEVGATARKRERWAENLLFLKTQKNTIQSEGIFRENKPTTEFVKVPTFGKNTVCNQCKTNCHIGCRKIGMIFCDKFDWWFICKTCGCKFKKHDKVGWKYEVVDKICQLVHKPGEGNLSTLAKYEQALIEAEQQREEVESKLSMLLEKAHEEIQNINKTAMLDYSMATYLKDIIKREEEAHNNEKAEIFRKLLLQEELKIASL